MLSGAFVIVNKSMGGMGTSGCGVDVGAGSGVDVLHAVNKNIVNKKIKRMLRMFAP
jgi:hypothetical protein